jgi:hypothetical protein
MKRILIVGSWRTAHITRFLRVLCSHKDDDLIIDAYDPCYETGQINTCGVNSVYRVKVNKLEKALFSIRKIGTYFLLKRKAYTLSQILKHNHYDLVNFHFIPSNVLDMVKVCKRGHTKVMLTPLGSDVLRVGSFSRYFIKKAFAIADYVSFNTSTGFCKDVMAKYSISSAKIRHMSYGSEVFSAILKMKGRHSRTEYSHMLSIDNSCYNIVCGYNASKAQRHEAIILALAKIKDSLPQGYQIIVPLSYGADKELIKHNINEINKSYNLNICYIEYYLTVEQVSALRLLTDLFIHVQTTDAYNASLQEFLLAGATCINGAWLKYPSLENNGLPYLTCDKLDNLSDCLKQVFDKQVHPSIHPSTILEIQSNSWEHRIQDWLSFYSRVK